MAENAGSYDIIQASQKGVGSANPTLINTNSQYRRISMTTPENSSSIAQSQVNDGRFKKGERRSVATEFKPGQHWRPKRPHWEKDWLVSEYVVKQRSCGEIAESVGCTENNVIFWLKKHGIPRRNTSEARKIKHWGNAGESNPMFGKRGAASPTWKGGTTPERQLFYSSIEWKAAFSAAWERDKGTCQRCGTKEYGRRKLHVHHIVPFKVVHLRTELSNLLVLCHRCHMWVHSRKNVDSMFLKKAA